MSVRVMSAAWAVELAASEKLVLLALADCANDEGHCWPGLASLCRKTGRCKRSLQESLRMLDRAGHITRTENPGKGMNYIVHPVAGNAPVAASSTGSKKAYRPVAKSAPKPSRTINASEAKASSARRIAFLPPPNVPDVVWADFLNSPKRRKAGMSNTAYVGICNNLNVLAEHGFPPGEMIALAVERGWVTVKLKWVENDQRTNSMGRHQPADGLSSTARAAIAVFGAPGSG